MHLLGVRVTTTARRLNTSRATIFKVMHHIENRRNHSQQGTEMNERLSLSERIHRVLKLILISKTTAVKVTADRKQYPQGPVSIVTLNVSNDWHKNQIGRIAITKLLVTDSM